MQASEQQAIATVAVLAAWADGAKHEREREELRRVAESLGSSVNLPALLQQVILGRVRVQDAAAGLATPELRQLAFEIAVGVVDADGLRSEAETRFLAELGQALGLSQPQIAGPAADADAIAVLPLAPAAEAASAAPAAPPSAPSAAAGGGGPDEAELDRSILQTAILTGALELLPQNAASLAIIPLQMRLVYRVGAAYGYTLDRDHIKDLLATAGVGITGQYLETFGRKLVGGLLGKLGGGIVGGVGRAATGAAFSFATTYALGHLARRYYAQGRTMDAQLLRSTYTDLFERARGLQTRHLPEIEARARNLRPNDLLSLVRSA
ncbi:MAG TPA: DUF533 domain-containing protein [Rubrivivax sp.]|nr:DUF533 domain-containing protein [Rubrivivax sp.]